jgi:hypothetical protein
LSLEKSAHRKRAEAEGKAMAEAAEVGLKGNAVAAGVGAAAAGLPELIGACITNPALCSEIMGDLGSGLAYSAAGVKSAPSLKKPVVEAASQLDKVIGEMAGKVFDE